MRGLSFVLLLSFAPRAWADCDPAADVERAQSSLIEADFDGAQAALDAAEHSFSCAQADPLVLGRMWLIEGALLSFQGDPGAADSFGAAARVAPGMWVDGLGDDTRQAYEDAQVTSDASAQLGLTEPLAGYVASVDGKATTLPATLGPGLHLIQVGKPDQVLWSQIVLLFGGDTQMLSTNLPHWDAPTPEPVAPPSEPVIAPPEVLPPPQPEPTTLALFTAIGAQVAAGSKLSAANTTEPATKLSLPLELGARYSLGEVGWLRGAATLAPLFGGRYLYSPDQRVVKGASMGLGGYLAGGASLGEFDLGMLAGVRWPGRVPLAAVVSRAIGGNWHAEARFGVDLATDRSPEPTAALLLTHR